MKVASPLRCCFRLLGCPVRLVMPLEDVFREYSGRCLT